MNNSTGGLAGTVPTMAERGTLSMRSNKSKDTKPEMRLRQALRKHGLLGYRVHMPGLPGKPDVCFTKQKVAVFVHGCCWHRCPNCRLPDPKTNAEYWLPKLRRNVERDAQHTVALQEAGWAVVVVWECEVKRNLEGCVEQVATTLKQRS